MRAELNPTVRKELLDCPSEELRLTFGTSERPEATQPMHPGLSAVNR
jgi:hypothetical protein